MNHNNIRAAEDNEFNQGDTVHFQAYKEDKPLKGIIVSIQRGMTGNGLYNDGSEDKRLFYNIALPERYNEAVKRGLNMRNIHFTCTTSKSIVESKNFNLNMYNILSPDGIPIYMDDFSTKAEALEYFENWKSQFKNQGYYSSNNGRIDLADLKENCQLIAF